MKITFVTPAPNGAGGTRARLATRHGEFLDEHLGREVVDLGLEVVVHPHTRDGDGDADGRGHERLGDTAGDRAQTGSLLLGNALEGIQNAHHRAEQSHEGGHRGDGSQGERDINQRQVNLARLVGVGMPNL